MGRGDIECKINLVHQDLWVLSDFVLHHQSLDLTLSDLDKSKPTVSPDKPIGQLWAASSSVIEAQSLTNSGKSSRISWKIC